ncbi:hypothetical protein B566_EDAN007218 [Ephemera danica]|nr:hypothetical protein B566_EDAN007218 [Ephemera danica]
MSELGLNEQHSKLIKQYLEFTQQQRVCHLRTIDCLFQDVVDARLLESSYTVDEVMEMLAGLRAVVSGEARDGLAGAAHAQVLLLQQVCTQAERWHLHLEANFSELENRSLLEQVAVQQTARHIAEKALRNAEKEMATLENQMRQLEAELSSRASVMEGSPSCEELTQSEIPASTTTRDESEERRLREELKQTNARLTLAEQELQCKVNESAAFSNLRRMLDSKNEQLRSLRAQLAQHQQNNAPTTIGDAGEDED